MQALNRFSGAQDGIYTVLDIGSSKVSCVIGRYSPYLEAEDFIHRVPDMAVLGVGICASSGVKHGGIIDLEEAEDAIRTSVSEAERMAGLTIDDVVLPVSTGRLQSLNFAASDTISGHGVAQKDIDRLMLAARQYAMQDERALLHMLPIGFRLDQNAGIKDPRGMIGCELATDIHAISMEYTSLSNLLLAVERCDLRVSGVIASPYASAIATIVPEEARLGVTCIDLGGGTSKVAVFAEGHFIYADSIRLGGQNITRDIARALNSSEEEAERVKTLHGNLVYAGSGAEEMISVARVSDPNAQDNCLTTGQLAMIIRPRVEEILSTLQERLEKSGLAAYAGHRVVLTGGTAELSGIDQFAAQHLGKPVRRGLPLNVGGLPDAAYSASFATPVGTLLFDIYPKPLFSQGFNAEQVEERTGYLARVGQWIKESF